VWADGGGTGRSEGLGPETLGWRAEVARHPGAGPRYLRAAHGLEPLPTPPRGFRLQPRRWAAGWAFAGLGRGRLAREHEGRGETLEGWIDLAAIRLLAIRPARRRRSAQRLTREGGQRLAVHLRAPAAAQHLAVVVERQPPQRGQAVGKHLGATVQPRV
jgi:hypothetical protein